MCLLLLRLLSFLVFQFLHGVLCGFFPWLGVYPFLVSLTSFLCLSMLGPFRFRSYYLGFGLFLWALLHLPCASSSYCLFRPWAFPSLPHYWFLSPRSSSLFLSAWCFLSFLGGSPQVSHPSLRVVLFSSHFAILSCYHYVLLSFTPSLLSRSFLPWLVVIFRSCFFSACSCASNFLIAYFSCFFPLSLSLCVSSFSCLLFFQRPLSFSFPSGYPISLSGVSFQILLWLRVLSSSC